MSTTDRVMAEIEQGDTLSIDPDVGSPYRATVEQVHDEAVTIRYQTERGRQRRQIDAVELATFRVQGRLVINPPARRGPNRRRWA